MEQVAIRIEPVKPLRVEIAEVERALQARLDPLEGKVQEHTRSIESLQSAITQTDDLVERVVDGSRPSRSRCSIARTRSTAALRRPAHPERRKPRETRVSPIPNSAKPRGTSPAFLVSTTRFFSLWKGRKKTLARREVPSSCSRRWSCASCRAV